MATKSLGTQLHAGKYHGQSVYHTNSKGHWWSGFMFHDITEHELMAIALSVVFDLIAIYPNLAAELFEAIEKGSKR